MVVQINQSFIKLPHKAFLYYQSFTILLMDQILTKQEVLVIYESLHPTTSIIVNTENSLIMKDI